MKKIDSGQAFQILANVGVIAGIVFLALEIRQSNNIAITTTEISVRDQYISFHQSTLENEDVAMLLAKARDSEAVFSLSEEERIYAFVGLYVNNWVAIETAYRRGMIPNSSMEIVIEDIKGMLDFYKALGPYFRAYVADYQSLESFEFVQKLNETTNGSGQ